MDLNQAVLESLKSLEPQAEHRGWEQVYRERVQAMARGGDLAILARIIDRATARYRDTLLGASSAQECDLARGGILALRGIWVDLRNLGVEPEDESEVEPTVEHNEFAILDELKEDLTLPY